MTDTPQAKKSLGQHWLNDVASLQAMCEAAAVSDTDVVLEVGPGLGTLTEQLLQRAKQVIAVEFDSLLAKTLESRLSSSIGRSEGAFQVVEADILQFDFTTLPPDYKLVANIPYYLTSNLIRVISETPNPPANVALLIQKEVAERVAAQPGAMSLLSVSAQFYWQVRLHQVVPAELFTPLPKVDSQIISFTRRTEPLFAGVDTRQFFRLVKAGYSGRRKTLLNSLSGGLGTGKPAVRQLLETAGIDPGLRAQALALDDWYRLYQASLDLT